MRMKVYLIQRSGGDETFLKVGVTRKKDANDRHFYGVTKVLDSDLPLVDKIKRVLIDKQTYMEEGPYPQVRPILALDYSEECQALFVERTAIEQFSTISYRPRSPLDGASECFVYSKSNEERLRAFLIEQHDTMTAFPFLLFYKLASMQVSECDPIRRHLAIIAAMAREA